MHALPVDIGWIEVICGPMFSGKTEELIRRLRRSLYARQTIQVFKPSMETRYAALAIVSHSRQQLEAEPITQPHEMLERVQDGTEIVGIDEAQFFDDSVVEVAQELAARGLRVVIAGLDQDYRGEPFGPMPQLLAVAEFVTKTLAICVVCGNPAGRTQRLAPHEHKVLLGAEESYEARCRRCHSLEAAVAAQPIIFRENMAAKQ